MIAGKRAAAEMMMIEQNGQQVENDEGDGDLQWLHQAVIDADGGRPVIQMALKMVAAQNGIDNHSKLSNGDVKHRDSKKKNGADVKAS